MTTSVLSYPELDQLEGGSRVKGDAAHIGAENSREGRIVRFQIFVNCTVQNGGESTPRDHAVALHEIPLLRRRYGNAGFVTPRPHWVSGVARVQGLSEAACREEERRLRQAYGEVFHDVYGGANGVPPCLWAKAIDLIRAWNEMQERCRAADRRITAEDINAVIATIEPKEELSEAIEPIDFGGAEVTSTGGNPTVDGALLQRLAEAEVPDDKAEAFAREVALAGGPGLSEEAWLRIPGVGNHKARRDKLLRIYEEHVSAG